FSLLDGSLYNFAGYCLPVKNGMWGLSAVNLRSGDVEIRQLINDPPLKIQTNQWAYLLTWAGKLKQDWGINCGLNLKYVYYDLYGYKKGGMGADIGISQGMKGPVLFRTKTRITGGLAVQNVIPPEIKLISEKELLGTVYRMGLTLSSPVFYRLHSIDTLSLSTDLVFGDNTLNALAGCEYTLQGQYLFRAGYYRDHVTSGIGLRVRSIRIDYAIDFSDFSTIHRLGLGYAWRSAAPAAGLQKGPRGAPPLLKEARRALRDRKKQLGEQKKITNALFKAAKADYKKKRFLAATDKFRDLLLHYPDCTSAREYYEKITAEMHETAGQETADDLERLSYAKAYAGYYRQDFEKALNEWQKVLLINPERNELTGYVSSVQRYLEDENRRKRERETGRKVRESFESGVDDFIAKRWISCIRKMEKAQGLCRIEAFPEALEWHNKSQEYIDKAVKELSRRFHSKQTGEKEEQPQVSEIDFVGAERKYTEGLILYAQGKVIDAINLWEISARLNPGHEKAMKALKKAREELEPSGKR
ncbi:MAG: hypothetical protein ACYC5N_02455, partial [Endomicrobiales bacterium]